MLIDFKQAASKYNMQFSGLIHVGAHYGQEYHAYRALNIDRVLFIEPCEDAFKVLQDTFGDMEPYVRLFNAACGSEVAVGMMNTEHANKGMSNSLLKPAKHLQQYPSIQFTGKEEVEIHPLDNIVEFARFSLFNTLVMDVQGYELEVLKGSKKVLKSIQYIYTEVNRDEVYEGNARVEELDTFLTDFARVETSWAGGTWGDAIYIRKTLL